MSLHHDEAKQYYHRYIDNRRHRIILLNLKLIESAECKGRCHYHDSSGNLVIVINASMLGKRHHQHSRENIDRCQNIFIIKVEDSQGLHYYYVNHFKQEKRGNKPCCCIEHKLVSAHKGCYEEVIEIEVASYFELKKPKSPGEQSVDCIPYKIRNHQLLELVPDIFKQFLRSFRLEEIARDEHEYHHMI